MKYMFNHSGVAPLSIELIQSRVSKDVINEMKIFIRSVG